MNFTRLFIHKPIMTVLIFLTILIFGVYAYFSLPVSDLPEVKVPVVTISASLPGATPQMMAESVASPLENACMQINGIQSIISTSSSGSTSITLTFNLEKNVDLVIPDVQAAITNAQGNMPTLPSPPQYSKSNPSDSPIMYIMVNSETLTNGELYEIAQKKIAQRINMIDGVSSVVVYGAMTAQRIKASPDLMASYGLGISDIVAEIQDSTPMLPGGNMNAKSKAFGIQLEGQLTNAKEYGNVILKYDNGSFVKVSDIGDAYNSTDNELVSVSFYYEGQEVSKSPVLLLVFRQSGTNTVTLSQNVSNLLNSIRDEIPGSVQVHILYDKASTIVDSINDVKFTLLLAFILVVIVIFIFLGRFSDTVIPAITLPLSIFLTFAIMYLVGFTIDNLSLLGIILAVGFVVDDAIVVLENSVRLVESGMKPFDASLQSVKEITGTVVSMTLSLVAVFIPLIFMSGIVGRTFREFALTVTIAVLSSGFISLTLTPMMCARMLKENSSEHRLNMIQKIINYCINHLINGYSRLLKCILKHSYLSLIVWALCIIGSIWFYTILPKGFLPVGDSGVVQGAIIGPLGVSSYEMKTFQNDINNVLAKNKYIDAFVTGTGLSTGSDQSFGFAVLMLKDITQRPTIDAVVGGLEGEMFNLSYPLGFVYLMPYPVLSVSTGGSNTASGSKYSYTISGPNEEEVYKSAKEMQEKMEASKSFIGVQSSVKLNMPQINVIFLRERAAALGVTVNDIESTLSYAYSQGEIAKYTTSVNQYDVIFQLEDKYQDNPEYLNRLYIKSSKTGNLIPFSSVAEIDQTLAPNKVYHSQQLISATLSFNLQANIKLGTAINDLESISSETLLPGVSGHFEGEAAEFESSVKSMEILIILAIFILYVILGILYESYIHPFTIITTLPIAAFGGLGTLLLFNSELNLYAYVGFFMLLGIIAKNGIMMVDFAKQNRERGMNKFDSIHNASLVRFRPILMTGVAAIAGAIPIAIGVGSGGGTRVSLGLVVVGGLIFAQIITLFVTPGIYLIMESFQEKFLDRFELSRSTSAKRFFTKK